MRFVNHLLISVLTLGLILSTLLSACTDKVSAAEISTRAISAASHVDSLKADISMSLEMSGVIDTGYSSYVINETLSSWVDYTGKQMQMTLDGLLNSENKSQYALHEQIYVLEGWLYASFGSSSSEAGQWSKYSMTAAWWDAQDQMAREVEFLKTAVETKSSGSEVVDGLDCYILQIGPDMDSLTAWLQAQQNESSLGILSNNADFSNIYKDVTLKIWVAKTTYLPAKEELAITANLNASNLGYTATSGCSMPVTIKSTVKYYDYNVPFKIVLPTAAAAAPARANIFPF